MLNWVELGLTTNPPRFQFTFHKYSNTIINENFPFPNMSKYNQLLSILSNNSKLLHIIIKLLVISI